MRDEIRVLRAGNRMNTGGVRVTLNSAKAGMLRKQGQLEQSSSGSCTPHSLYQQQTSPLYLPLPLPPTHPPQKPRPEVATKRTTVGHCPGAVSSPPMMAGCTTPPLLLFCVLLLLLLLLLLLCVLLAPLARLQGSGGGGHVPDWRAGGSAVLRAAALPADRSTCYKACFS